MARKRYSDEDILKLLREIEVRLVGGAIDRRAADIRRQNRNLRRRLGRGCGKTWISGVCLSTAG